MTEAQIQSLALRELTRDPHVRLFRSNTGIGWVGQLISKSPDGTVVLGNARPLHAGLVTGSGDAIGWVTRNGIAVFASLEFKGPNGRPSPEQLHWRDTVLAAGGIAGIVRSVEEARLLVS